MCVNALHLRSAQERTYQPPGSDLRSPQFQILGFRRHSMIICLINALRGTYLCLHLINLYIYYICQSDISH